MNSKPATFPEDISLLLDAPLSEVVPWIARAAEALAGEALGALLGLVRHRILWLLRRGSRAAILAESRALAGLLLSEQTEKALEEAQPGALGAVQALAELLVDAAGLSDRASVPAILASHPTYGRRLLEHLAEEGTVPRSRLRVYLGISESQLSHLLRDFDEAALIIRTPSGRQVDVELGQAGREFVNSEITPRWSTLLADALEAIAAGAPPDLQPLIAALQDGGFGTRIRDRLIAVLSALAKTDVVEPEPDAAFVAETEDLVNSYSQALARGRTSTGGDTKPVGGFALSRGHAA